MIEKIKDLLESGEIADLDITIDVTGWSEQDINEIAHWCGEKELEFWIYFTVDSNILKKLIRIRV